jgi:hypothetical protein
MPLGTVSREIFRLLKSKTCCASVSRTCSIQLITYLIVSKNEHSPFVFRHQLDKFHAYAVIVTIDIRIKCDHVKIDSHNMTRLENVQQLDGRIYLITIDCT